MGDLDGAAFKSNTLRKFKTCFFRILSTSGGARPLMILLLYLFTTLSPYEYLIYDLIFFIVLNVLLSQVMQYCWLAFSAANSGNADQVGHADVNSFENRLYLSESTLFFQLRLTYFH